MPGIQREVHVPHIAKAVVGLDLLEGRDPLDYEPETGPVAGDGFGEVELRTLASRPVALLAI